MDSHSAFNYVTRLERYICDLHRLLGEWRVYVPSDVIQRSQVFEFSSPPFSQSQPTQISSDSQDQGASPPGFLQREAKWRKPLDSLIKKIPSADGWTKTVCPKSVSSNSEYPALFILHLLFQQNPPVGDDQPSTLATQNQQNQQNQHSNILSTLAAYASLAQKCADDAKQSKLIASYQKLLLGALCHVACCTGVDENSVNKMMGLISNGGPDHLRQMRLGVLWAVNATNRLQEESDWGIRSGDIFFYFMPSFTSLGRWAKANQSMDIFTSSLKTDQFTKSQQTLHTNHLSVPCIVKCLFGRSVLLSDICTALHTDLNATRGIFFKWYLEAFGCHSMDDSEQQRLFYSITYPISHPPTSQRSNYFDPVRDAPNAARKRQRISDSSIGTSVDDVPSGDISTSSNIQQQTALNGGSIEVTPNIQDDPENNTYINLTPGSLPDLTEDSGERLAAPQNAQQQQFTSSFQTCDGSGFQFNHPNLPPTLPPGDGGVLPNYQFVINPLDYPSVPLSTTLPPGDGGVPPNCQFVINPLDYPSVPLSTTLQPGDEEVPPNYQFVINPLDYPSVPLSTTLPPGDGRVPPNCQFVINPLDYPSVPLSTTLQPGDGGVPPSYQFVINPLECF